MSKERTSRTEMDSFIKEMDVIECVANYLEVKKHFTIMSKVNATQEHGVDLIAVSPGGRIKLYIEAKGQTSSDPRTKRYGKEFNENQKKVHLGKALLNTCQCLEKGEMAGIALPDDKINCKLIDSIGDTINRLGIIVFLVNKNHSVAVKGALPQ
jgi:hypothetical protein